MRQKMARFLAMTNSSLEHVLVDKWHQILNANTPVNGSPTTSTAGQANGKSDKEKVKDKDEDEVTKGTQNLDLNGKSS